MTLTIAHDQVYTRHAYVYKPLHYHYVYACAYAVMVYIDMIWVWATWFTLFVVAVLPVAAHADGMALAHVRDAIARIMYCI